MKIVYILTSTNEDLYFEQFWVSLLSLKKHNPNISVVVLTDKETQKTFSCEYRKKAMQQVNEVVAVDLPSNITAKQKSRYLKTSSRKLIKGDFLFLDCDTIICGELESIKENAGDLCMVSDLHTNAHNYYSRSLEYYKKVFKKSELLKDYHGGYNDCFFNSGVMFVRDTKKTQDFFCLWHRLWQESCKYGIITDQQSLNEANYKAQGFIKEISGIYNCQLLYGMKYILEAKVLHLFCTCYLLLPEIYANKKNILPYKLCDEKYYKKMKETGDITEEVQKIIDNPKSFDLFCDSWGLATESDEFYIFNGRLMPFLLSIYRRPVLYKFFTFFLSNLIITAVRVKRHKIFFLFSVSLMCAFVFFLKKCFF